MTFEESQQIIQQILDSQAQYEARVQAHQQMFDREMERILATQRDLQEGDLRAQERLSQLEARSQAHEQNFERELGQILAVQRDLQEGQLAQLGAIEKLLISSERQERIMNQLIGYSITNESDHLDLEEKIRALGVKVQRIEQQKQ
jgi:hypothetical protein